MTNPLDDDPTPDDSTDMEDAPTESEIGRRFCNS